MTGIAPSISSKLVPAQLPDFRVKDALIIGGTAAGSAALFCAGAITAPVGLFVSAVVAALWSLRVSFRTGDEASERHAARKTEKLEEYVNAAVSEAEYTQAISHIEDYKEELRSLKVTTKYFSLYAMALDNRLVVAQRARGIAPALVCEIEPDPTTPFLEDLKRLDASWVKWAQYQAAVMTSKAKLENYASTGDAKNLRRLIYKLRHELDSLALKTDECKWHLFEAFVRIHELVYERIRAEPIIRMPPRNGPQPGEPPL